MANLGSHDIREAQALIHSAYSASGPAQFADRTVQELAQLVPGEVVGYNERELDSQRLLVAAETPSIGRQPEITNAVTTFCSEYPLSMRRHHAESRALTISDFLTAGKLHRLSYYNHALRPLGLEYQIRLWLSAPPGIARYFYISRRAGDKDFAERDRDILQLLRPFLVALHERFDAPGPERTNCDGLTDREVEVLGWVARGKTNHEIAALLVVSPHTIRKHLEHCYEKLRVHTRTAAVARAFAT
ncbi:MAG TPA: helix-turn-helix transcriptional regulator [Gaiellaceae bacterium]|jgi:DNA-binding CsgD family transcriptional regulator